MPSGVKQLCVPSNNIEIQSNTTKDAQAASSGVWTLSSGLQSHWQALVKAVPRAMWQHQTKLNLDYEDLGDSLKAAHCPTTAEKTMPHLWIRELFIWRCSICESPSWDQRTMIRAQLHATRNSGDTSETKLDELLVTACERFLKHLHQLDHSDSSCFIPSKEIDGNS